MDLIGLRFKLSCHSHESIPGFGILDDYRVVAVARA
jgi:hypothetical protein